MSASFCYDVSQHRSNLVNHWGVGGCKIDHGNYELRYMESN